MSNLQYRQKKIQEKRKKTQWRDFLMEIGSRRPLVFYKNSGFISRYPETSRSPNLISSKEYQIAKNNLSIGIPIEKGNDFFNILQSLYGSTPTEPTIQIGSSENSLFADVCGESQNVYLSNFVVYDCENVCYSMAIRENISNVYNSLMVFESSSNIYQCAGIIKSHNIFYSKYIRDSSNVWFCRNLIGCSFCIGCSDLVNKSYCINNIYIGKEEYHKQFGLHKQKYILIYPSFLNIKDSNIGSIRTSGIFCSMSEDVEGGFFSYNQKSSRNIYFAGGKLGNENMYDVFIGGAVTANNYYAVQGFGESEHIYCSAIGVGSNNIYYSYNIESCSFCLGCIGLKNKQFCILNKQYSKEERYEKVDEIFSQMEKDGTLGEFFPGSMCPFYFNDTAAYLIDPSFTKEEVTAKGYLWRDEPIKVDIPVGSRLVLTSELDQYEGWIIDGKFVSLAVIARNEAESKDLKVNSERSLSADRQASTTVGMTQTRHIDPEILNCIIQDEAGNVYRIVKMEYDFLMKHGLPLPRKHRLDRMKENFTIAY